MSNSRHTIGHVAFVKVFEQVAVVEMQVVLVIGLIDGFMPDKGVPSHPEKEIAP